MRVSTICLCLFLSNFANAQTIDAESHRSIADALQKHVEQQPSIFPLESPEGGVQSFISGMRYPYFGYGERKYSYRTDFHPAFDVAYVPLETGYVETAYGETRKVRAPQTYRKRVYAIQTGTLYSAALIGSGYKIVLKHKLAEPYVDSKGREYFDFYTSYRHVDARSIAYLSLLARRVTGHEKATYEDIIGKHQFRAGELVAFVGFSPAITKTPPRSHLDFSLNLMSKPNSGQHIRDYSVNPLLLFPPFEYADPYSYVSADGALAAYQFVINADDIVVPGKRKDGHIDIEIHSGFVTSDGAYEARRYFALNAMTVTVTNDDKQIGSYVVDRHQKLGYDTSSNVRLDKVNQTRPHFLAPLDEQGDVYRMGIVIPARWLRKLKYDWAKPGKVRIEVSSIWDGHLLGHSETIDIPLL